MKSLDNELKNLAHKEKHSPPADFSQKIDEALKNLPPKPRKISKSWQKIGGAIAAVLAIAIMLPNLSQNIAHAMGELPLVGSFFQAVTFRTYDVKDGKNHVYIDVPEVVSPADSSSGANIINQEIADYTSQLITQYETEMHEDGYFNLDVDWEVVTDTENWFTLKVSTVTVMAGSNEEIRYYHIDATTGELKTLSDLFPADFDYITVISDELKQQMQARMAAEATDVYWLEENAAAGLAFSKISADHNFYFDDEGRIVIPFNKYEVGPGSTGTPEFTLESPELYEHLLYHP